MSVTLAAMFVAGCGGGSSSKGGSTSTTGAPGSSTTAGATTSTTVAAPAADIALAKVATLTLADLGSRWKQYKAATGALPLSGRCGYSAAGPLSKVGFGAYYSGPQLKFKANTSYVYSTTVVFPDDATASAWVAIRKAGAFKECARKRYDAGARKANATLRVVTDSTTDPNVGRTEAHSQYADFVRYDVQYRATNGKFVSNGDYDLYLYRHGRVMIEFELDRGTAPKGDANAAAVDTDIGNAVLKVLTRTDAHS